MDRAVGYSVLIRGFRLALSVEGLRPHTVDNYVRDVERFSGFHGGAPASVTSADVRAYVTEFQQTHAPKTVHETQLGLRRFFLFLVREGELDHDPTSTMKLVRYRVDPQPVERQRQWDTSEGWKTREREGSASSWTEGRVTRERSRRDPIISRQTRGLRGADRADQILCTTSQIGYAAQVHLRREDPHSPRRLPSRGHGKRSVQARGDQASRPTTLGPRSSWRPARRGLPVTACAMPPGRRSTPSNGRTAS